MTANHDARGVIVRETKHPVSGGRTRVAYELRQPVDEDVSVLIAEVIPTDDEGRAVAERFAACWNAGTGIPTDLLQQVGIVVMPALVDYRTLENQRFQWMKVCALLLNRYALKGETIRFTPEDMLALDEVYPTGADLRCEDGDNGSVHVTLVPPGERPTGIIVVEGGGRIATP